MVGVVRQIFQRGTENNLEYGLPRITGLQKTIDLCVAGSSSSFIDRDGKLAHGFQLAVRNGSIIA